MTVKEVKPTINRDGLENSNDWGTPDWLYKTVNEIFKFDYDPCPLEFKVDGLDYKIPWDGKRIFINPPYDRVLKPQFIKRTYCEWLTGKICVLLIPSATGTKQFHKLLYPGSKFFTWDEWKNKNSHEYNSAIVFFEGRIAFKGVNTKGEYVENKKGKYDNMLVILNHPEQLKLL